MSTQFATDVQDGLDKKQRTLPSKYFYDRVGDELFVKIMHSEEYYLTRAEFEIFSQQTKELFEAFRVDNLDFDLIELGAGDGTKTLELLKAIPTEQFVYKPVDISGNALSKLEARVQAEVPGIQVSTLEADYFEALRSIGGEKKKVVLFLGSNLGNMLDSQASTFMMNLSNCLNKGDIVLLGLDLKKPGDIVLPAYNDSTGYTKAFNMNLLHRINTELGGNFNLDLWEHAPQYDSEIGMAKSFLKSRAEQSVTINSIGKSYYFKEGELIHTEISRKYDEQVLENVLIGTSLSITRFFYDSKEYFTDVLLQKQ